MQDKCCLTMDTQLCQTGSNLLCTVQLTMYMCKSQSMHHCEGVNQQYMS